MLLNLSDVTVSLEAVINCLIAVVYAAVGIFIIVLIIKIMRLVKKVNILVDDNSDNITKTLSDVPVITENIKDISTSTKQVVEIAGETAVSVMDSVSSVSGTIKKGSGVLGIAGTIAPIIMKLIRAGKVRDNKKKSKNKKNNK